MTTTTNTNVNTTATAAADATVPAVTAVEKKEVTFAQKAENTICNLGNAFVNGVVAGHTAGRAASMKVVNKVNKIVDFQVSDNPETLREKAKAWARKGFRVTLYTILVPPTYLASFIWNFCKEFWKTLAAAWKMEAPTSVSVKPKAIAVAEAAAAVEADPNAVAEEVTA